MNPKLTKAQERLLMKLNEGEQVMQYGASTQSQIVLLWDRLIEKRCVGDGGMHKFLITEAGRKVCEGLK